MLPVNNLINQIFFGSYQWDIYNQRFSSSIPVDRVTGAGQTQIGYWSDSQLWQTIAWSRFAYERNPVVKGIINILIDHIGKPHVEWVGDKVLARKVSKLWEKFSRVNCLGDSGYLTTGELSQDREKEIRVRWLRDGEVFIRFFVKDVGYPLVLRFVEPEQVRTPPIDRDEKFSHTWGIVTEIDDNENIRGYWVYYPNQGEWDYVHRRYMVYGRRNADRNVKRGLPEIANLELDFAHLWQLLRGVTITSKAQASIAWIEKYPGAMLEQILAHSISTKDTGTTSFGPFKPGAPNLSPSFYGVDPNAKAIDPGTILSVNQGKEYEPGPTSDPQKYIDACASILHLLSLQWCLPDWITKGPEAYASALVSGSPFVRRIESMQADYAAIFGQVCTTFVRLAERLGWLERKTLQKVQPVVRLPSVIMADEIKQVETLQKELQSGLLSEIEYLHKRGRDPRKTLSQRKKWRELLSKYGVGNEHQGVFEDKEKTKPKKFRDYLNPPGSRILREEECRKVPFKVTRRLTGECETVSRCEDWKPGKDSPYVIGCESSPWSKHTSTGIIPDSEVERKTKSLAKKTIKIMEKYYKVASGVRDHNTRQQVMSQVNTLSSLTVTIGFLRDLSSYPPEVKLWVMDQIAEAVQGEEKMNKLFTKQSLAGIKEKLEIIKSLKPEENPEDREKLEQIVLEANERMNELINGAVKIVATEISEARRSLSKLTTKSQTDNQDGDKKKGKRQKSASTPILDMLAEMAVDNLEKSIKEKDAIVVPGDIPNSNDVKFALGDMDFIPKDILGFLGGSMTLGSIDKEIDKHERAMLRSSILKSLAGKVPYLENLYVSEELSKFAFGSFVSVSDKPYAKIMSEIDTLLSDNKDSKEELGKLEKLLEDVLKDCPNIYGSLGEKTREINNKSNEVLTGIKAIPDIQTRRKIVESILLRCIFSYGTAEIARRGNEEAWARIHGAGMAYNPQFPGIDNVTTLKNDDGTYTVIPMSHKMHMTKKSNKPEVEFGEMERIGKLMLTYKDIVYNNVKSKLAKILEASNAEQKVEGLKTAIRSLEVELEKKNCTKVDWSGATISDEAIKKAESDKERQRLQAEKARRDAEKQRRDECFQLDYERMILLSLSPHISDMKEGDHEMLEWEPISLVRYRGERVEFWKRISLDEDKMGNPIVNSEDFVERFTVEKGGTYSRNGYESRDEMVRNCVSAFVRRKHQVSDNNSQVQQPQTK